MKFKKKPVVIDAAQYMGNNEYEIQDFTEGQLIVGFTEGQIIVTIPTLEGNHTVSIGDWIIKGVKGEFYPCKPDIFDMTYEKVK